MKHKSLNDCLRRCRLELSLEKCDVLPNNANIMFEELGIYRYYNFSNIGTTKGNFTQSIDCKTECSKICPNKDCFKTYFKASIKSSSGIEEGSENYITITPSSEPYVEYENNPKLETIEFLCYIASIISLWFGFSFLSIYWWFENIETTGFLWIGVEEIN